jgi:hypothetical protein
MGRGAGSLGLICLSVGWSFPVNEYIDASVFRRWVDVDDYKPKNVLEWSQRVGRPLAGVLGDQPAL